ncbi:MAG: FtsX-like permease family protein [Luteitalea sp.]|nr:FtsX-like permease family protein [Luteitalea sp.]
MSWISRVVNVFRTSRVDPELDEELQFHVEERTEALMRDGLPRKAAEALALRQLGRPLRLREESRDIKLLPWLDSLAQDVRFALRGLRKSPSFAFAAVCTLALGIGANTAIFSVVYAALFKPLPYTNPDELVAISVYVPQLQSRFPSLAIRPVDFEEFRRSNRVFADMAAIRERNFTLTGRGEPERLYGARVSANLFPLLGVQPQLGRTFLREEDVEGHERVVVISHDLWRRRFGADPSIINRTLSLDGQPHIVIGVMPAGFLFPTGKQLHSHVELGPRIDVWKPAAFNQYELSLEELNNFSWGVVGRLKPGTPPQVAQANLDVIAQSIVERMRAKLSAFDEVELRTLITPLRDVYFGSVHQSLVMLMGAVGLLLVIGCVNLVNLLLARLNSRSRELATRAALGAPRSRLVRQLITESVVVAVLGGAAGIPVAAWGTRVLIALGPSDFPAGQAMWLNGPVFLFAMTIVLGAGLAVGLVPATEIARGHLHGNLKDGGRGMTTGKGSGDVRRALVTSEVALCTALLVVAGLLLRGFVNLMRVDKGFEVERVLSVDLALSGERYQGSQRVAFYRDLLDNVRGLPGVASAGAISILPLTSESEGNTTPIFLEADTKVRLDRPVAPYRAVTPGYFAAMGIPLAAGRFLEAEEPASNVVVSERLATHLWPDTQLSSVVGRRIKIGEVTDDPTTIVGVVGDVRAAALDRDPVPALYVPYTRARMAAMTVVIRTTQEPETLAAAVRAQIWKRDNSIPVETMRTMREIVSESVAPRRFQTALVLLFALLALGLALVGVYGVTSYAVARQTQEIGVRLALGAQRSDLLRSVLAQGLRPVVAGLLVGLVLAWTAATAIRSFLFGVAPLDPVALGTVSAALILTAAMACYLPARRAARIDPVVALRRD